jgi:uncharacterized protein YkwD
LLRILIVVVAISGGCSPALSETLNFFRHAHGLPALQRSSSLQAMAHRHASSMAMRRTIDHSGFYAERGKAGARAENVAAGCASESCAITLRAGSSGHRANMLLSEVRRYGLASAAGGGERYWCLVLGR